MGKSPCPDCEFKDRCDGFGKVTLKANQFRKWDDIFYPFAGCHGLSHYEGYQEGLAEAESRVKAREREIVDWLEAYSSEHLAINRMPQAAIVGLKAWLQGKELKK